MKGPEGTMIRAKKLKNDQTLREKHKAETRPHEERSRADRHRVSHYNVIRDACLGTSPIMIHLRLDDAYDTRFKDACHRYDCRLGPLTLI
jgi:hypothetical protein